MRSHFPFGAGLAVVGTILGLAAIGQAMDPPPGYYASAEGLAGPALRSALHGIITNATVIPYSSGSFPDTRDALEVLDQDPANSNNVVLIYARRSEPKSTFALSTGWNREHLWPNSLGIDDREPAYSDLFNLRAADLTVNNERGNKYFDTSRVADGGYLSPAHGEALLCSTDANSWEPPEIVKGDIARAMFYMDVRYEGDRPNESDLSLTDQVASISSTGTRMGRLATLLLWHRNDPVDGPERARNQAIYDLYQHNRNPFIDRPEFAALLYEVAATNFNLEISRQGGFVTVSWPGAITSGSLENAQLMTSAWTVVTNAPGLVSNRFSVQLPASNQAGVFRLRVPE